MSRLLRSTLCAPHHHHSFGHFIFLLGSVCQSVLTAFIGRDGTKAASSRWLYVCFVWRGVRCVLQTTVWAVGCKRRTTLRTGESELRKEHEKSTCTYMRRRKDE
jgi:hypothetical protein